MAKFSNCNTIPATGSATISLLIATLILAGWTVQSYGDGTTYTASGTGWSSSILATGLRSWVRVREPGGRREWIFQRITGNTTWRVKYSANAKFSGGSPAGNTTPTATDEQVLLGAGTDASPTGAALLTTDGTYRAHIVCDSTAVGNAYPFMLHCSTTTTGAWAIGIVLQDPMIVGSYDSTDVDPVVVSAAGAANLNAASAWQAYGTGSQAWATMTSPDVAWNPSTCPMGNGVKASSDLASNKAVPVRNVWYATTGGSYRLKGWSHYTRIRTQNRVYPATVNKATDCFAYQSPYLFPFADATDPLL
ncbi:MAG TPA: hypothetical protein VK524_34450 [Polyangiaceae bacterium]|nr:hypothetical protein [Polyangiaceae bacterium]